MCPFSTLSGFSMVNVLFVAIVIGFSKLTAKVGIFVKKQRRNCDFKYTFSFAILYICIYDKKRHLRITVAFSSTKAYCYYFSQKSRWRCYWLFVGVSRLPATKKT